MRNTLALSLLLTLCCAPSPSHAQDPQQTYKAFGATASKPVATISYGPDPIQVADLRVPHGKGPFPVAIIIHGGCWRASVDDRSGIAGFADALTKRGIATWNIEYRRVGNAGGGWPGTFQDVAAAVDRLVAVAPRYRLDLSRVVIVGHSAGAHLALWAASRSRLPAPWNASAVKPRAVVAIDGPGALAPFVGVDAQVCGGPVIVPLMGGTPAEKPRDYAIASPSDHLPLGLPQYLVKAALGPFMQRYVEAARAAGDRVEVIEPKNADHFDIVTPTTANGAAVIDFIVDRAFAAR